MSRDDADDHARAKPTVRRTAGVHVDLAHVYLLSVTRQGHSHAACRLTALARMLARRASSVRCGINGSLEFIGAYGTRRDRGRGRASSLSPLLLLDLTHSFAAAATLRVVHEHSVHTSSARPPARS
jgi:hypothetical protein